MTVAQFAHRHHNDPHFEQRCQLAASFRWVARLGMNEGVANHFSLAVNDEGTQFLMNPRGKHFSRIKASDLLLIDALDDATMQRDDAPDPTAWALHGTLHRNDPNARCAMHVHSKHATVLACLQDPRMLPIDQNTMRFFDRLAFDDGFDGMGLGDEATRVCAQFDGKPILVMGNHGVMVSGPSVAWTFDDLYYFERAAETLITAYTTGKDLLVASDEIARKTMEQWMETTASADDHLSEIMAILDDEGCDYRD